MAVHFIHSKPSSIAKPENPNIIALIFYGHPETMSILDCYMKQNLATNGGPLDEVHWAVNTDNQDSLNCLDELVKTSNGYKKTALGFDSIWEHAVERGNINIKIDDDIVRQVFGCHKANVPKVYVHKDAISNLLYSILKHPEAFDVSANLVNSPSLSWLHYHMGAIHPYLLETKAPNTSAGPSSQVSKVLAALIITQLGRY